MVLSWMRSLFSWSHAPADQRPVDGQASDLAGRWQAGPLSQAQRQEVARLASQVEQWRSEVAAVLELADDLKDNTIQALLPKSDLEVGLEALLGQEPHHRRCRRR